MNESGTHIVILASRLDLPGGIERAVSNTANLFHSHGHKVTLLILDESAETFYPIAPGIQVYHLPVSFGITAAGNPFSRKLRFLTDVLKLRKALKAMHPTLAIATEYPFAAALVLSGARKKCKLVSWEHHHMNELEKNGFWERVFKFTYPRLHQLVCLNPDEKELFKTLNPSVTVIPNSVDREGPRAEPGHPLILTVARLNHVKGIDLLIRVAAEILSKHPTWKWKIIGHGRMDDEVQEELEQAGLSDRLILQAPAGHDLSGEYSQASLFVLTSRNECFPMTLLEALGHGVPCIAFDCETGPRHIINDGQNGRLLPLGDTTGMANAIDQLIRDRELRKKMGENAFASVAKFSKEEVYARWRDNVLPAG